MFPCFSTDIALIKLSLPLFNFEMYFTELDELLVSIFCSIIFETSPKDDLFRVLIFNAPPIAPSPKTTDAGPVTTFILSTKKEFIIFELCTCPLLYIALFNAIPSSIISNLFASIPLKLGLPPPD